MPDFIDRYRTGGYGEDFYNDFMECSCCGGHICEGESYYDVDGTVYCMHCEEEAGECILETVREEYIYKS